MTEPIYQVKGKFLLLSYTAGVTTALAASKIKGAESPIPMITS